MDANVCSPVPQPSAVQRPGPREAATARALREVWNEYFAWPGCEGQITLPYDEPAVPPPVQEA